MVDALRTAFAQSVVWSSLTTVGGDPRGRRESGDGLRPGLLAPGTTVLHDVHGGTGDAGRCFALLYRSLSRAFLSCNCVVTAFRLTLREHGALDMYI